MSTNHLGFTCILMTLTTFARLSLFRTGIGEERAYWVVSLGLFPNCWHVSHAHTIHSFGLLHRIPPQPTDRLPGSTPPELRDAADEYEQQALFVPADSGVHEVYEDQNAGPWQHRDDHSRMHQTNSHHTMPTGNPSHK